MAVRCLAIAALGCGLLAAQGPRLNYSKSFPGSVPAWVGVTLERSGAGLYRDAPDDDNPLKFKLSQAEADEIFGLVDKLDRFQRPLESPLKVAFMGMKTFRWENGAETGEVMFNFSEDVNARALADWFERIGESEQHFINLQRAAKYDRLGVFKALLQLEASMDRKRLVALEQYLPLLDRIAKNEGYMHTARVRASAMAEAIRGGGSQAAPVQAGAAQ